MEAAERPEPGGAGPRDGERQQQQQEEEEEEEEEEKGSGAEEPAAPGEEAEEERRERAALLAEFRALEAERRRLRQRGVRLEPPLGEALRTRSSERRQERAGGKRRLARRLRELRELWRRRESEAAERQRRADARRRDRAESGERAAAAWAAFQARKKAVAVRALGRRRMGGAEAALRAVSDIQARETDKESSVREARLENIKVKLEIRNLESALRARGEAPAGRHAAAISHMKKENRELGEKLRGLSGRALELKLKVANAQLILGRVTDRLRLLDAENRARKAELADIERALLQKRDELSASRTDRDGMRARCLQLRQQRGLRGEEMLLRDLEEKVTAIELLGQQLEALKRHHAELVLQQRAVQEKVREAHSFPPRGRQRDVEKK